MKNKKKTFGYIRKNICSFLKSLLVRSNHKAQFRRYISTGYIDEKEAIELYDNLLFNLQNWIKNISMILGAFTCAFLYGNAFGFFAGLFLSLYLSIIITYYPCRIIINSIYPRQYHNGSNKNYSLIVHNFGLKDVSKIRKYVPIKPSIQLKTSIGAYSPWKCPKCKKRNIVSKRMCYNCDFEYYWECINCNTLNISDNLFCIKCDMERSMSKYLREKWVCKDCQEEHENIFTKCWKCSEEKTKWVCKDCQEEHENSFTSCWKCSKEKSNTV